MDELKPCPFEGDCGVHAALGVIWDKSEHSCCVECSCGANGPLAYSEADAVNLWNRRSKEQGG